MEESVIMMPDGRTLATIVLYPTSYTWWWITVALIISHPCFEWLVLETAAFSKINLIGMLAVVKKS